jgi:hypothetical protein
MRAARWQAHLGWDDINEVAEDEVAREPIAPRSEVEEAMSDAALGLLSPMGRST